jgi:hypothetical protein
MPSSGLWRHVDFVWTDVSEESIGTIFRVEKIASEEPAWPGGCITKMEAIRSSETSVHTKSTRHHNPKDGSLDSHSYKNFKSSLIMLGEYLHKLLNALITEVAQRWMVAWLLNWTGFWSKWFCYKEARVCEEKHENLIHICRSSVGVSIPIPIEYKSRTLLL